MIGKNLPDKIVAAQIFAPATPSSAAPRYISLKGVQAVEIVISGVNTASGVTGSAVTLNQATAVAGTSAKALGFNYYYASTDQANSYALTNTNATSNTFTTLTTGSRQFVYRIPVDPASLDTANSFDCLSVGLANAVNTTISVTANAIPGFGGRAVTLQDVGTD